MSLKGALICLLAVSIGIDAAKNKKLLKKLAKPNELGYKLEDAVKSNLKDDVSSNYDAISNLLDKINVLQADYDNKIASISNDVASVTRCTGILNIYDMSCCTSANPCGPNQGDCDSDDQCSGDLRCGTDNCIGFPSSYSSMDCCFLDTSVWFDAWSTNAIEASGSETTITYTNVRESSSNSGAMDIGTGVFTASMAGTYQFVIQVMKDNDVDGYVKMKMDGSTISVIYNGDADVPNRATITGTAVITVNPGQKVWAETYHRLDSNPDGLIHFTGVLITPE